MKCSNCGNELNRLDANDSFCPYCGARLEGGVNRQDLQSPREQRNYKPLIIALGAATAVVVIIAIAVVIWAAAGGRDSESRERSAKSSALEEESGGGEEAAQDGSAADDALALADYGDDEAPLYENVQPQTIDVNATDITPGEKSAGMTWDDTFFYWLEDCDTLTDEDGNIAYCTVTKTIMLRTDNGKPIRYEVYRDADTGEIYKIVSIYDTGSGLELTDFYYVDGEPNFTFERTDSVYTPTYATIDKTGYRYYFDGDVMVRLRWIDEPQAINEITLTMSDTWYAQMDYYTVDDAIKNNYNTAELAALNLSRHTYSAIMADAGIGTLSGYVRDTSGNPVQGATVKIYRNSDGVLLYKTETGSDGSFDIYIYLDGSECSMSVSAGGTEYLDAQVGGVNFMSNSLTYTYNDIVLYKEDGAEYKVRINAYDAFTAKQDENGALEKSGLDGVTASFRAGSGNRTGNIVATVQSDSSGQLEAQLSTGTYTVELSRNGYMSVYIEIEVAGQDTESGCWLVPEVPDGQTAVLLTWDGDGTTDLDLTVFTPSQSTGGDMAHIGGGVSSDGSGNRLISDNADGCELIYLNTSLKGSYKIYVNDYTDSLNGLYTADRLAALNVHIYIYGNGGLLADYAYPSTENGVVWEVAEVSGGTVAPSLRVYVEITGKTWWTEEKGNDTSWAKAYYDYFSNLDDFEWAADYRLVYIDDDNIPEIYGDTMSYAGGSWIYTYKSGKVVSYHLMGEYPSCNFKSGLIIDSWGKEGVYWDNIVQLSNGNFEIIAETGELLKEEKYDEFWSSIDYSTWDDDYYNNYFFDFTWNDESVTYEEYKANWNAIYDETKSQDLYDSNVIGDGSLEALLDYLSSLY